MFVKRSNSFFTVNVTNNICPLHSIFSFFNHKNFFKPTWSVLFCNFFLYFHLECTLLQLFLIFSYSYMITNFIFRIFHIILFIKVSIFAWLWTNKVHFNCALWYPLLYLFPISANLSINIFFDTEVIYLQI